MIQLLHVYTDSTWMLLGLWFLIQGVNGLIVYADKDSFYSIYVGETICRGISIVLGLLCLGLPAMLWWAT
jgi:hypothetical protein